MFLIFANTTPGFMDIFCKIIKGELPSKPILETKDWIAIHDINPQAPIHVLIIPKQHLLDLQATDATHQQLLGELLLAAPAVAKKLNLGQTGYRLIINQGSDVGQLVPHLHIHLLGGKKLGAKLVN